MPWSFGQICCLVCLRQMAHLAARMWQQPQGPIATDNAQSTEHSNSGGLHVTDMKARIRAELATWDPLDLWSLAEMRIFFRDDAEGDVVDTFCIRQGIAREMTRHGEYWRRMSAPSSLGFPEDEAWIRGTGQYPVQAWLNERYPGIPAYFQWSGTLPPTFFWLDVERTGMWAMLEATLLRFMAQGERVPNRQWLIDAMTRRSVLEHLGVAPVAKDLVDLIWAERDKAWVDPMELLNQGVGAAFGMDGC